MKAINLLVFTLIVSAISAQDVDYLQNGIKPENHDKRGKWVYYGKERPDSIPFAYDTLSRRQGIWSNHPSRYDRISGKYTSFYPNKAVKETGTFAKNQFRDSLIRYFENGQREYEAFYNQNGKEEGQVNYYFSNGQLEFNYNSKNGTPTGKATRYYVNGDVKELIDYAEDGYLIHTKQFEPVNPLPAEPVIEKKTPPAVGDNPRTRHVTWKPDGYNKVYNEDDEIWQDGVFKEGKLCDGKVYIYDQDGILVKVMVYRSGEEH